MLFRLFFYISSFCVVHMNTLVNLPLDEGLCKLIFLQAGAMPKHERKEVLRMLKLVQKAQKEINKETSDGEKTVVLGK